MLGRISSTTLVDPSAAVDIDPADRMMLELFGPDGLKNLTDGVRNARAQQEILDLFERGQPPRRYSIGWSPMVSVEWHFDDAAYDIARRYLRTLDQAPLAVRFVTTHDLYLALSFAGWIDRASSLMPEIERLSAKLDSDIARRHCAALGALEAEDAGRYAEGAQLAERAITGLDRPTGYDALAAMRLVRLKALAGHPVMGDDLRRPFEWFRSESLFHQIDGALCSCAIAVDLLGRHDLADRMTLQVMPVEALTRFIEMYQSTMSERLTDLLDSDQLPNESLDDLIAAVFRFADELDRRAADANQRDGGSGAGAGRGRRR
jgi:hypothetical protein